MKCVVERASLIAAVVSSIGSAMSAYAPPAFPKATFPKSIASAGAGLVVTGSLLWLSSAVISYIRCHKNPGIETASIEQQDKKQSP